MCLLEHATVRDMVKVAVKWNKRVFEDVELAPDVVQFKAKLQELTVSKAAARIMDRTYHTAERRVGTDCYRRYEVY